MGGLFSIKTVFIKQKKKLALGYCEQWLPQWFTT